MKVITLVAALAGCPSIPAAETTEEMGLRLLHGQVNACVMLAQIGVDLVHERQIRPDFQIMFDDLNAARAREPEGITARVFLFMTNLVAGHPHLAFPENIERWKSEVYLSSFDYCRQLTKF